MKNFLICPYYSGLRRFSIPHLGFLLTRYLNFLKERGISEEVSTLAQKRWETLRAEASLEPEKTAEVADNSPRHINRLLHRLKHRINHPFS